MAPVLHRRRRLLVAACAVVVALIALAGAWLARDPDGNHTGFASPTPAPLTQRAQQVVEAYARGTSADLPSVSAAVNAQHYTVAYGGRNLTTTFAGAPDEPGPCGADYEGRAFETPAVVVLEVHELTRGNVNGDVACPAIAQIRTVDVPLLLPLGERVVLSYADGAPIPRS